MFDDPEPNSFRVTLEYCRLHCKFTVDLEDGSAQPEPGFFPPPQLQAHFESTAVLAAIRHKRKHLDEMERRIIATLSHHQDEDALAA